MGKGFCVGTSGTGFHITFRNGHTVSVQFGPGTYSDNHDNFPLNISDKEAWRSIGKNGSSTAEVAVLGPNGEFVPYPSWDDDVHGYAPPEEVLNILLWAAKL